MTLRDQRLREQQPGVLQDSPIMDIVAMREWVKRIGGRAGEMVRKFLDDGRDEEAREAIAAFQEQKRAARKPATPQRPVRTRPAGSSATQVASLGRRQGQSQGPRTIPPPPSQQQQRGRPMVQKGGLYRGKPHAYVAGGSVTDTSKRSRRKQ